MAYPDHMNQWYEVKTQSESNSDVSSESSRHSEPEFTHLQAQQVKDEAVRRSLSSEGCTCWTDDEMFDLRV